METEDSRLLRATRLLDPLTQKIKAQTLYGAALFNKHTDQGENKEGMVYHMLMQLSIFGRPQVAYKKSFACVCLCQSHRRGMHAYAQISPA